MKRWLIYCTLFLFISSVETMSQLLPNLGGQRTGISSLQFLKIGVGGRGSAMGESMVAVANDISAIYWNPAGVVLDANNSIIVAHAEWLVDLKHDFIGITYHLTSSDVIGLSLTSLRTDDMPVTTEFQPFGTGEYFRYSDLAIGATYSRQMTSQFSFGTTVKYVHEKLAKLTLQTVLFDLGTYYTTGIGSLRIGVAVSNFGADVSPDGEVVLVDGTKKNTFQSFSPPTLFKVGVAFEPLDIEQHRITASIQLNHPNDNAENVRFGIEYGWNNYFFARLGLRRTIGESWIGRDNSTADDYSFGVGVNVPIEITTIKFDYAFSNFNQLGKIHRISCSITY